MLHRRGSLTHRRAEDVPWHLDDIEPVALGDVYRYKALLGIPDAPSPGATMGLVELMPGTYPFHEHPAPEIYYVLRGRATWTVGRETFLAKAGTAIYHAPGARHRMVNRADDSLLAVWFWWAPGGDASVLDEPSRLSVGPNSPRRGRRER